jgi:hypothetical protein
LKTLATILLAAVARYSAEIIEYNQHYVVPLRPEYLTIPKFAPRDAPNWAPGLGKSYIDLSRVEIYLNCNDEDYPPPPPGMKLPGDLACTNSTFDLLMFEEPTKQNWMDYWPDHEFCCTPEMVKSGE